MRKKQLVSKVLRELWYASGELRGAKAQGTLERAARNIIHDILGCTWAELSAACPRLIGDDYMDDMEALEKAGLLK